MVTYLHTELCDAHSKKISEKIYSNRNLISFYVPNDKPMEDYNKSCLLILHVLKHPIARNLVFQNFRNIKINNGFTIVKPFFDLKFNNECITNIVNNFSQVKFFLNLLN